MATAFYALQILRHGLAPAADDVLHFPDGTNLAVLFNLDQSADGRFLGRQIEGRLTGRTDALKQAMLDGTVTLGHARLASRPNASVPVQGGDLDLRARVHGPLNQL